MAAKLPGVMDYGARTSLRSNRIDEVHPAGVAVAESLAAASQVFSDMYVEKKTKDDRLKYALAKNEITKAEIAQREKLKGREDWESFDSDYTTGFNTERDRILGEFTGSESDRALLGSDSDVMRERGRAAVGEMARGFEIDQGQAQVTKDLEDFAELIEISDSAQEQNQLMLDALEMIAAASDPEGKTPWFTDTQAQDLSEKFVSTVATSSLGLMDAEPRLVELKKSMAKRKSEGPISREDIAADKGSNSIADFLHASDIKKMIEMTEKEIEIEQSQDLAFEASDASWDKFREAGQIRERENFLRDYPGMTPEARKEALLLNSQRRDRMNTDDALSRAETARELTRAIYESGGTAQLDAGRLSTLTPNEQEYMHRLQKQVAERREWADHTTWAARELWDDMTPAEKSATDFDGFMHRDQAAPSGDNIPWKTVVAADRGMYMSSDRGQIKTGSDGEARPYPGLNQEQLLDRTLVNTPLFEEKPTTASDEEDQQRWATISDNFNNALIEANVAGETITPERRKEILTEVLAQHVFVDEFGRDPYIPVAAVLPGERDDKYLPLNVPQSIDGRQVWPAATLVPLPTELGGATQTPYSWINNQYKAFDPDNEPPSKEIAQHIWAIIVTEDFYAAQARIIELTSK